MHRSDSAAISAGERRDLALLPQLPVDAVLHDRYVIHHRGRLAIDVFPRSKRIQDPVLTGEPCDHAGLDGAKVRDDEAAAF